MLHTRLHEVQSLQFEPIFLRALSAFVTGLVAGGALGLSLIPLAGLATSDDSSRAGFPGSSVCSNSAVTGDDGRSATGEIHSEPSGDNERESCHHNDRLRL